MEKNANACESNRTEQNTKQIEWIEINEKEIQQLKL